MAADDVEGNQKKSCLVFLQMLKSSSKSSLFDKSDSSLLPLPFPFSSLPSYC